jgi:peptidoglycan/LPS O-acetylase OafA/YrhL
MHSVVGVDPNATLGVLGEDPVRSGNHRVPALDGLRAIAVSAVVLFHLGGQGKLQGGFVGVDVFFVLSGYLITTLLIAESDRRHGVSFNRFYERRSLRLFPALAAVVLVCIVGSVLWPARSQGTLLGLPWVVLFAGNWDRAIVDPNSMGLLAHTWSLAIEEQFYLLWPALFVLVFARIRRRELAGAALFALALAEIAHRMVALNEGWIWQRVYNGLDTHSDGLLIGCGIAFLAASPAARKVPELCSRLLAVLGCLAVVAVALWCHIDDGGQMELAITVAGIGTGLVLWSLVTAPIKPMQRFLEVGFMVWIGCRSYGIYLWHFPILLLIGDNGDFTKIVQPLSPLGHFGSSVVIIVLSVIAAAASYRWIERPALRLKNRLPATPPLVSVVGMPTA